MRKSRESQEDDTVVQVREEAPLQDEAEAEAVGSEEDTNEEENSDEEGHITIHFKGLFTQTEEDDDGEARDLHVMEAIKTEAIKKNEGEEEAGIEVTFDTHPVLVETPLTEGFKKITELELELNALEKKEELIKMQKATVLQELRKEKKRALLLLKNSLEHE